MAARDRDAADMTRTSGENRYSREFSRKWRRYLRRWRSGRPPGVLSGQYLRPRLSPAMTVHRRTIAGSDRPAQAVALLPAKVWRALWWSFSGAPQNVQRAHQRFAQDYAGHSGVGPDQQLTELSSLARRNSLMPLDVYRLELFADDGQASDDGEPSWASMVFDHEVGWNLAASVTLTLKTLARRPAARIARRHMRVLSDKHETARRLARVGVPTVDEYVVPVDDVTGLAGIAEVAARRWPTAQMLFAKPRAGSAGIGGFVLTRSDASPPGVQPPSTGESGLARAADASQWSVAHYRSDKNVEHVSRSAAAAFEAEMAAQEYLIQPRLTTAVDLQEVASDVDVVTMRIVTRNYGLGPQVFSRAIEVPLPPRPEGMVYLVAAVASDGAIEKLATPEWMVAALRPEALTLWEKLKRLRVPGVHEIDEMALRAHQTFPGVYAVAWDVALTDRGPVFLEGNTGFGTLYPQLMSGGLLDVENVN